jgi:hypothetical protein
MGACKVLPARYTTQAIARDFALRSEPLAFRFARQFRPPAFLRRGRESLTEVCAGKREGEAAMANLAGESSGEFLRLDFNRRLMVQFRESVVTSRERYVLMPTKSALPGARRADVTDFGMQEHHGDGSALPRLVQSSNLSLEIW